VSSRWYLPDRYYATRIGSGETAINLVTIDTSSFIDGYLDPSSSYSYIDEEITQVGFLCRLSINIRSTLVYALSTIETNLFVDGYYLDSSGRCSYINRKITQVGVYLHTL
jgi:hypothetical protein